jgi:HD-like signal output (HDOD) protein
MPMYAAVIAVSVALALLGLMLLAWILTRRRAARDAPGQGIEPPEAHPESTAAALHEALPAYRAACADAQQRLHQLAFGAELTQAGASAPADLSLATTVRERLAQIAEQPNYAPRRPMMLPRLIQAMRDDDVSRRELARIIASDPVLAGNLVRLANSPLYRHREDPIESLDRAVAILGTEGMRSLATAALLQPVFRISGRHFERFGEITWEYTFLAASAAEAHAAVVENSDPFAAQLLALILGLAAIVVFRVASDTYLERGEVPVAGTIAGLIDTQSVPVARQIAAGWELSARMDAALADQATAPGARLSSLGRSLLFGRFAGALAVLRARTLIDDDTVAAALRTGGQDAGAFTRIWERLAATRA